MPHGCFPSCKLHSRSLAVGCTVACGSWDCTDVVHAISRLCTCIMQSRDCTHVTQFWDCAVYLGILRMRNAISRLRKFPRHIGEASRIATWAMYMFCAIWSTLVLCPTRACLPAKRSSERNQISWAYYSNGVMTNEIPWSGNCYVALPLHLTTVKIFLFLLEYLYLFWACWLQNVLIVAR